MEQQEAREGTVFVGEDFDGEMFMWPGKFSVHWESPDGKQFRDGPRGLSAQEAIEWGRSQADHVYIRPGDSNVYYSAGAVHPEPAEDDDDETPVWIDGTVVPRRRDRGYKYMDRTSDDPPIAWHVSVKHDLPGGKRRRFMERFRATLEAEPAVSDVNSSLKRRRGEFEFVVQARTQAEAQELAQAIDQRARQAAWPELGDLGDRRGFVWSEMNHVSPVESDPL